MIRDLGRLARDRFDVLVLGGGIYGLTAALEGARQGLSVALVERHDLGSGTSFNHHKTLHGGLRYLQSLDLPRMRESIRERRAFARMAGPLVSPQPFVMPTTRSLTRGPLAMRVAFMLDRLVAADRNAGVPPSHILPAGRVVDRAELARLLPDARLDATGGALWYDYVTADSERLTFAFASAAARHGALLANYADAIAPLREGSRLAGMQVRDAVTGEGFPVRASVTLNAAGAGAGRVMAMFGARRTFPLLKAMNVVTRRPGGDVAVACPTAEGRMLVALPWRGRLLVGTSHGADLCGPDQTLVNEGEVDAFLVEINSAFPWLDLALDDVALVHRGVVPAKVAAGRAPGLLDRAEVRDHAADGIEGAVSVVGVKYTTARAVAERAIGTVLRKLGRQASASGEPALVADDGTRLGGRYGAESGQVTALGASEPALAAPVAAGADVTGAEVLHAVRHEMALTLEDVVVRRTAIGAVGHPGDAAVAACAAIVARELGWSAERLRDEIAAVGRFYELGRVTPPAAPLEPAMVSSGDSNALIRRQG
jgi:glycerol-3-phosphate dehydrogenase